jgi:hypothetical protein
MYNYLHFRVGIAIVQSSKFQGVVFRNNVSKVNIVENCLNPFLNSYLSMLQLRSVDLFVSLVQSV